MQLVIRVTDRMEANLAGTSLWYLSAPLLPSTLVA